MHCATGSTRKQCKQHFHNYWNFKVIGISDAYRNHQRHSRPPPPRSPHRARGSRRHPAHRRRRQHHHPRPPSRHRARHCHPRQHRSLRSLRRSARDLLHNINDLDLKPADAGIDAVLFGHTHQPKSEIRDGVLYFNPGSAGPRRFDSPVSLGFLTIAENKIQAELKKIL
jgi:hypothetical protein